jgi:hypothetical protein
MIVDIAGPMDIRECGKEHELFPILTHQGHTCQWWVVGPFTVRWEGCGILNTQRSPSMRELLIYCQWGVYRFKIFHAHTIKNIRKYTFPVSAHYHRSIMGLKNRQSPRNQTEPILSILSKTNKTGTKCESAKILNWIDKSDKNLINRSVLPVYQTGFEQNRCCQFCYLQG